MIVELISIGNELLIGQTINTNQSWLGEQLTAMGFDVQFATTIQDERNAILDAFDVALDRSDVVIVTGGLGPTKDDITKKLLCEYFDTDLVLNETVLDRIRGFFESLGRQMQDVHRLQAMLPESAVILDNHVGTASGMLFEDDGQVLISLPGVPYEMKQIMLDGGFNKIANKVGVKPLSFKMIYTQGIGESDLAERIEDIEDEMRARGIDLAYLPSPGKVRLRISTLNISEDETYIDQIINKIMLRLPKFVYSTGEEDLSAVIGNLLKKKKETIGTVESCTAGALAAEVVRVTGASSYFQGGLLTYSNGLKNEIVKVDQETLDSVGAVSREVVEQMAVNGKKILGVDYCISTSGIAGPTGGTEEKPIGTVWIGIAHPKGVYSQRFLFGNNRERNINKTVHTALNLLRCLILELNIEKS